MERSDRDWKWNEAYVYRRIRDHKRRQLYAFVLGTDNGEQFVQEQLYGVCDNLIYIYDVFTDTWNAAY